MITTWPRWWPSTRLSTSKDSIVWQDMMLAEAQQNGWESKGFDDYYLADQESRVRYFHEVLNDYLAGRKGS